MLEIKNISKKYITGELVQNALKDVTLNLRDSEFVAILGPSGSGKTTLLNIIGGLDRYDSGDLIINNISTKKYKDRDWDSYRNHTIGFVFQSYNLIPHQSVLSNVELALTISGISKKERRERAVKALTEVGLGDQLHKRPNQMSGGQMQRVAIARALVNNPDILLADEPTGALDSETSVQVMELLKKVAKDRLVIMVTHNPELAVEYANRIVKLRDGEIVDDSNPFFPAKELNKKPEHKNMGKSSMSFFTSLALSFNNLRTKKGRTFLTSFAGSIGIIGIALILSLSTGVNTYIEDIQRETMTAYPVSITAQTLDLSGIMSSMTGIQNEVLGETDHDLDKVYSDASALETISKVATSITENNLTEFKKYLDNPESEIHKYLGENGIVYSYGVNFDVYAFGSDGTLVNTDGSTLNAAPQMQSPMMSMAPTTPQMSGYTALCELTPGNNGKLISPIVTDNYEVIYGEWPVKYDEVVLVLNQNNEIPSTTLYSLGLLPSSEYKELTNSIQKGEEYVAPEKSWSYEDIVSHEFYIVPASDYYVKSDDTTFRDLRASALELEELVKNSKKLQIVGIIKPTKDESTLNVSGTVGYTYELTKFLIDYAEDSEIVKAQMDNPNRNVLSGMAFAPNDDQEKITDCKEYLSRMGISEKAKLFKGIVGTTMANEPEKLQQILTMDEATLAKMADGYLSTAEDEVLLSLYDAYVSPGEYDDNLKQFGYISLQAPSSINLYTDSFEDKDMISQCIDNYNLAAKEENKIVYTDFVALMTSSITTIVNVISYVLIAFVAVSLVVSSIMIGIITYISVLERTKEIGILRAIGASKKNISQVFNAETFIIGLCSGLIGIGVSSLLLIPGNAIIHALVGSNDVNAILPIGGAVILIILSVILTLIGGIIPSKKAAKKDPVTALRTE
jgi:putative ABC transport system permease protein